MHLLLSLGLLAGPLPDRPFQSLLHFQDNQRSSIEQDDFFLKPGARLAEEFAAEYAAFAAGDADAACRFPARRIYFARRGLSGTKECPAFAAWAREFPVKSLKLVFSSAYAGNSASMFGHTLLKLGLDRDEAHDLLDYGVAFLAQTNPEDDAFSYMMKGLFGGYPGVYIFQPYYELVNQYAFAENRDLWELDIPLDEAEKELLLAHLWELTRRGATPYYFATVNCSAMLAEILDAIKPDWKLRARMHGFVLPSELMRLVGNEVRGEMNFRPSQRRIWTQKMDVLSLGARDRFRTAWRDRSILVAAKDGPVLDALLDRITMEKSQLDREAQKDLRIFEDRVLLARAGLDPGREFRVSRAENNPLLGHAPAHFSLFAAEELAGMRLRWGWHDLLDPEAGYEPQYHLNVLDLQYRRFEDDTDQYLLKIMEVWSLSPWSPEDPLMSWILAGSLRDEGADFEAAAGLSLGGKTLLVSILPGVVWKSEGQLLGRLSLMALLRLHPRLRALLKYQPEALLGERDKLHQRGSAELRWDIKPAHHAELRLADRRLEAGLGWHF